MKIILASNQTNEPHKCAICGKFIAWGELGKSAIKESDRYLSEFVHIKCASKIALETQSVLNKKHEGEI